MYLVDFLIVLIEVLSLGVISEALRANVDWKPAFSFQKGQSAPKFQVEGFPHQPLFSDKMLSYRRGKYNNNNNNYDNVTYQALQGVLALAKSGTLELKDNT